MILVQKQKNVGNRLHVFDSNKCCTDKALFLIKQDSPGDCSTANGNNVSYIFRNLDSVWRLWKVLIFKSSCTSSCRQQYHFTVEGCLWFFTRSVYAVGVNLHKKKQWWLVLFTPRSVLNLGCQRWMAFEIRTNSWWCNIHVNWNKNHPGNVLNSMFWQAAKASTVEQFNLVMEEIRGISPLAYMDLVKTEPK